MGQKRSSYIKKVARANKRYKTHLSKYLPKVYVAPQAKEIKNIDIGLEAALATDTEDLNDAAHYNFAWVSEETTRTSWFAIKPLWGLAKGTSNGQRTGDKVFPRKLMYNIGLINPFPAQASGQAIHNRCARLIIAVDKQNNMSPSVNPWTTLLDTADVSVPETMWPVSTAMPNVTTRKRWTILLDEEKQVHEPNGTAWASLLMAQWKGEIDISGHTHVWDSNNQNGRYAGLTSNALWIYVIFPSAATEPNDGTEIRVGYSTRVTYTD